MIHRQILPPPPTVEDIMDNVALTPYNRPQSAFNFEEWQEALERGLAQLLARSHTQATTVPSTDSSPKTVIHSVPLQFQPRRHEDQAPV